MHSSQADRPPAEELGALPPGYWRGALGARPVIEITPDEADAAVGELIARGRVLPMSRGRTRPPIGKPLSPTTVDRYCNDLDGLYRYTRRLRVIPRTHVSPLAGRERAPQPVDPERYFRDAEVEQTDRGCARGRSAMGALGGADSVAYVTGLRRGNLMNLRWSAVDLEARTVSIAKTKNGLCVDRADPGTRRRRTAPPAATRPRCARVRGTPWQAARAAQTLGARVPRSLARRQKFPSIETRLRESRRVRLQPSATDARARTSFVAFVRALHALQRRG